jgi:hypothetical protein
MVTDSPIVFISHSRIRAGQLAGLRSFLAVGVPDLEAAKPKTLAFLAYVDEASMTLTIVHQFADTAGFAAHVEGAEDRSDAAAAFIEPLAMEIHGAAHEATIAAIRSGLPPGVQVRIRADYVGGFLRLSSSRRL